jgi:hypothetical protein
MSLRGVSMLSLVSVLAERVTNGAKESGTDYLTAAQAQALNARPPDTALRSPAGKRTYPCPFPLVCQHLNIVGILTFPFARSVRPICADLQAKHHRGPSVTDQSATARSNARQVLLFTPIGKFRSLLPAPLERLRRVGHGRPEHCVSFLIDRVVLKVC